MCPNLYSQQTYTSENNKTTCLSLDVSLWPGNSILIIYLVKWYIFAFLQYLGMKVVWPFKKYLSWDDSFAKEGVPEFLIQLG